MLGLILLYFIGKAFADLATTFKKNKWAAAIGGIAAYYFGILVIGDILVAFFYAYVLNEDYLNANILVVSISRLPFGLLICYITYIILKKQWQKKAPITDTLDGELLDDQTNY